VFFHSANASGPWSTAAATAIARFAMATNEKNHGMPLPNHTRQSAEISGPAACRQVHNASAGETDTFFYLNSVIDWTTNYKLHDLMVKNPSWRVKNTSGGDIGSLVPGGNWVYDLSIPAMREAWVAECTTAVAAGCTGCFIDKANTDQSGNYLHWGGPPRGSPQSNALNKGHLAALTELSEKLAPTGNYAIYNHLGVPTYNTTTMMIEDFTGTEVCISKLRLIASRGFTVQAHAGNYPKGNKCVDGDTNAMAAFLIAAGNYSYYHCSTSSATTAAWQSNPKWPAVSDSWLDWLNEYDMPLGAPLGLATKEPSPQNASASLWSRSFASGTRIEFDTATNNGTIWWGGEHGVVQKGVPPTPGSVGAGCKWESV
jgi:hypothetical protein